METLKISITDLLQDDNTAAAGFIWESGEVAHEPSRRNRIVLGNAPHAKVTDVAAFEQQFPGVILKALDGTSIKVLSQAVTRRAWLRAKALGQKPDWKEMQLGVLRALRGLKARATVVVRNVVKYSVGDELFDDAEAAREYGRDLLAAKGLDDETIETVLDTLIREIPVKIEK
jgi:hypothetical protein